MKHMGMDLSEPLPLPESMIAAARWMTREYILTADAQMDKLLNKNENKED
jgi:hypothetical protein